jgi:2-succinyl-5-enolpyruvyl-6-hydroxy-3-cyclohexene-1-carboxylate synthase
MRKSKDRKLFPLLAVMATILCLASAFTTTVPYSLSTSSNDRKSLSQKATFVEDDIGGSGDFYVNGRDPDTVQQQASALQLGLVSPYHLLYPETFYRSRKPLQQELPLYSCLQLIRKAIKSSIIRNDGEIAAHGGSNKVLRIEHKISHVIDPLCWLQAQKKLNYHLQHPVTYFSTAEGTLEAAAFGSSITYSGTAEDDAFWDIVRSLPQSAYLYGGQRFDSESDISEEWESFSKGFWMLPAVEIRMENNGADMNMKNETATTSIAVHLVSDEDDSFLDSARRVLDILSILTDASTPMTPPTTLPPVLSRTSNYGLNLDGQELYEKGVMAALEEFERPGSELQKVVLARRMDLSFARHASENVDPLDVLRKWKFASQPGGHMFFLFPGEGSESGEFFGCTPERLFRVQKGEVLSEALAGTRPRGSTQETDVALSRQLFESTKDQSENLITGNFIQSAFSSLEKQGLIQTVPAVNGTGTIGGNLFVRRLRHLQHICQRYECSIPEGADATETIRRLLSKLHPTPAVGGFPKQPAMNFIREHETTGFDRGFYAGPVGYVGRDASEVVVAIRSGLLTRTSERPKLSVFAGAGIVPGSTVQGEWSETSYKLAVVSSIFPQSPITLQSALTPNVAWATAFIEELIRNGITQFYICPGSRSTPLVAAITKAVRSYVGVVHAVSIHDERGAGFRAVGYGRGSGRPAAVVTSSGTAVANLYPAVVESGMDGIPMLVLSADRPYENRNTGANQAIDQVKIFSDSYLRWFRDVLPPSDEVPVAVALADAAHAVTLTKTLSGPVHLNMQFRENLAPDAGPIRNDDRSGVVTKYDAHRFTESPGFATWSLGGNRWLQSYAQEMSMRSSAVSDIGHLISKSKRGIIVVGNLRKGGPSEGTEDVSQTLELLSSFAESVGFPVFASALSGALRFHSPCVVPFAEHILRCPVIQENLQPDLILQFGAPLVSTEIPKIVKKTMQDHPIQHVLVHSHHSSERADPDFTVTRNVDADIGTFVRALTSFIGELPPYKLGSQLSPIVELGRVLQREMPGIVEKAATQLFQNDTGKQKMSEPELAMAMSKTLSKLDTPDMSLFLSNSMPIRDAEAFLYPLGEAYPYKGNSGPLKDTGVNRGASGIDGIIASASGFADATERPTTLLIGDVAALHDLNSFHALRTSATTKDSQSRTVHPVTTIILNNDGGGIFSFLPIANHGADVGFEEFFGTPTNTFSFDKGVEAFGLTYEKVVDVKTFEKVYSLASQNGESSVIEAVVAPRHQNVLVHKEITRLTNGLIELFLRNHELPAKNPSPLPIKRYHNGEISESPDSFSAESGRKTLILLHGWMGDKSEWDDVGPKVVQDLKGKWDVVSVDLPGHGESQLQYSSPAQKLRSCLCLDDDMESVEVSDIGIDSMAEAVYEELVESGLTQVDAIAGYSLGGRVALAMKRASLIPGTKNETRSLISDSTKIVLLSAYPGDFRHDNDLAIDKKERLKKDDELSSKISSLSDRSSLRTDVDDSVLVWSDFLSTWYDASIWGSLKKHTKFERLMSKRSDTLARRGKDLAAVLRQCSPPRCRGDDWRGVKPENVLFISGSRDEKYTAIGQDWLSIAPRVNIETITDKGHALLVEAPEEIASVLTDFLKQTKVVGEKVDSIRATNPPLRGELSANLNQSTAFLVEAVDVTCDLASRTTVASLDFEKFRIDFSDGRRQNTGVSGIGWGENAEARDVIKQRAGFIIQVMSVDGLYVGVGEVSPLPGLHVETLAEAEEQLDEIASRISDIRSDSAFSFDARCVLAADGALTEYLNRLTKLLAIDGLLNSVRAGIEMALISLASQVVHAPIHQALNEASPAAFKTVKPSGSLSLNGLITRGSAQENIALNQVSGKQTRHIQYESWKVKVGHQSAYDDAMAISYAYQVALSSANGGFEGKVRADANRGYNETTALQFANILKGIDSDAFRRLEYVEEPLQSYKSPALEWSFAEQILSLERWHAATEIPYALDESISDLAELHNHDFAAISFDLKKNIVAGSNGCAALVLKPSLLGLELSLRLARFARKDLGVGAVFTSSFDSGVGLAFASFLASMSDASVATKGVTQYSHGLGTFSLLAGDCLSPSFGSYVNSDGKLNVASLSRSFYGLGLDELHCLSIDPLPTPQLTSSVQVTPVDKTGLDFQQTVIESSDEFEASTATSSDGREIKVLASLPLPFSAEVACARFTDLPQQPRWSPWISSVAYVDARSETEWTLRVRGVNFRWRAKSSLLSEPYPGISWKSISGLKNTGAVEFIQTDSETCVMKVQIAFVTPRILSPLFKGTSIFFEDFLRNKVSLMYFFSMYVWYDALDDSLYSPFQIIGSKMVFGDVP